MPIDLDLKEGRRLLEARALADEAYDNSDRPDRVMEAQDCRAADEAWSIWLRKNSAALLAAAEQLEAADRVVEAAALMREQVYGGNCGADPTAFDVALAALDQLRGKG